MPVRVELRDRTNRVATGFADSAGDAFDSAGDVDRFVDSPPYDRLPEGPPMLQSLDPFGETRLPSAVMGELIAACVSALAVAVDGPERRGLERLRILAEACSRDPESELVWVDDYSGAGSSTG